jgi:hypothetical protein
MMKRTMMIIAAVMAYAALTTSVPARSGADMVRNDLKSSALIPLYCNVMHNVGRIGLGISNDGTFGVGLSVTRIFQDCFTGERLVQCEYPLGSRTVYLFGAALWIGAVVGMDTLVSTGADGWSRAGTEFHPYSWPIVGMIYRSTRDQTSPSYFGAVSEQDYIAVYNDTCLICSGVSNDISGRPHIPLNIEVTQSSYAWSLPHLDDFVLMDYSIKNVGSQLLRDLYMGYYVDADVYNVALDGNIGAQDDLSGFREWQPSSYLPPTCPPDSDRVNLAWTADNNGDLDRASSYWVPDVTAMRIVRTPSDSLNVSFNWWVSNAQASRDYGPQTRAKARDFGTGGTGTPEGDRNKYFILSNGEFDFDQARVATIGAEDPIWLPPPSDQAPQWARGLDTRYVLSFGPFDIEPGEALPVTLAYVAGANLHESAENFNNLPYNPDAWYDGLNFDSLSLNAVWADWVYDNPGVDTDSDGYFGEFRICGEDTVWVKGDGVPDFRGTAMPEPPALWVEPRDSALYVRWNGFPSETLVDWASREIRFEGYHAYLSSSGPVDGFACVGSYDREDYFRCHWDFELRSWKRTVPPIGVDEAVCRYAPSGCDDPAWHPLDYTRQTPFVMPDFPDSILYFEPCMANACLFGLETPFMKRFPHAPKPEYASPQDVPPDQVEAYLTEDGYFKYYEYEFLIKNLLPEQPYWVSVTSFDYGSMLPGADPSESGITGNTVMAVPLGDCCQGVVGNADGLGEYPDEVSLGDIMLMIDAKFISADCDELPCLTEADINQSGGTIPTCEDITLGDIMILVDYLFITGPDVAVLPDCL